LRECWTRILEGFLIESKSDLCDLGNFGLQLHPDIRNSVERHGDVEFRAVVLSSSLQFPHTDSRNVV